MGEPANPTPEEQAETLALARGVVEAVTNDEAWPVPLREIGSYSGKTYAGRATAVFRLAQDLTIVTDDRDRWKARAEEAMRELNRIRRMTGGSL